jgi:hypothetical protein
VDTGSGTQETEVTTDATDSELGRISGVVELEGTTTAEGITLALLDENFSEVSALQTEKAGGYEFLEVVPGRYTVRATKSGYVNDERRVEVAAGEIVTLNFFLKTDSSQGSYRLEYVSGGSNGGEPDQSGTVGRALKDPFGVRLLDSSGYPVSFARINYEIVDGHSGGAMDGADIATGPDGEATNGYALGTLAGENHVRVWSPVGGNSVHFYPTGHADAPASLSAVSGDNQTGQVGAALLASIVVLAQDQYENVVPGAAILFRAGSGGSASPEQAITDASGVAQTTWVLGTKLLVEPPQQVLTAETGAVEVTLHATNISRTPTSLSIVSGDNQSARIGQTLPAPFVVKVEDDLGNPGYGHQVAWTTSTGGGIGPAVTPIGQDGLAQARGTMGALLKQLFFATIPGGQYVTFNADKVGDTKVSLIEPMLVWPGYPDASAENPEEIEVPLTIRGTGFAQDSKVVWNAGSADEEELEPTSVTATQVVVNVTADHFEEMGTYPIAVRNLKTDGMQSLSFKVAHTLLAPSAQDSHYCTKSLLTGWEWDECRELGPEDEAYGQDGHHEERAGGRWELSAEGTAHDNVTGLTWMRCRAGQTYVDGEYYRCQGNPALPGSDAKAAKLCGEVNLGAQNDWRVPSLYELFTLYKETDDFWGVDADIFTFQNQSDELWTSTRKGSEGTVDIYFGNLSISVAGGPRQIRCVRGNSVERQAFVSEPTADARIVTDKTTGLMWNACPLGTHGAHCSGEMTVFTTWVDALSACNSLIVGGFDDWRLASMKEAMTLLDLSTGYLPASFFDLTGDENPQWSLWTSTTDPSPWDAPMSAHILSLDSIFHSTNKDMPYKYYQAGALCVRLGY